MKYKITGLIYRLKIFYYTIRFHSYKSINSYTEYKVKYGMYKKLMSVIKERTRFLEYDLELEEYKIVGQ
jgi:hypothetical protein